MQKHRFNTSVLSAVLFVASLLMCPQVFAQCCPGGGDTPKAAIGLGQPFPVATDLAADPAWQVYEFERGGIRYEQVNDSVGRVRVAVGHIDDVFWVMPMGIDADRVSINAQPALAGPRKVLYRSNEVEVILYRTVMGDYWVVRTPNRIH